MEAFFHALLNSYFFILGSICHNGLSVFIIRMYNNIEPPKAHYGQSVGDGTK